MSNLRLRAEGGQYLLKALFRDVSWDDRAPYVLSKRDKDGRPSLYRLYMEANDLTEYSFATAYLDGWEHWERLCECTWFQPHLLDWRRELEIKLRSAALKNIINTANSNSMSAFTANKFLVERGWKTKDEKEKEPKRGRPRKEEIKRAALDPRIQEGLKLIGVQ